MRVRVSVGVVLSAAHLDRTVVKFLNEATCRMLVERLRCQDVVRPAPRRDVTPAAVPATQRVFHWTYSHKRPRISHNTIPQRSGVVVVMRCVRDEQLRNSRGGKEHKEEYSCRVEAEGKCQAPEPGKITTVEPGVVYLAFTAAVCRQ